VKVRSTFPDARVPAATWEAWAAFVAAMPQAVWLVDSGDLRLVAASAAAGRLCGADPGELTGRSVLEFAVTPEDEAFWHGAADGDVAPLDSETLVCAADGTVVPVSRRASRLVLSNAVTLFIVVLEDRRERVRRERELEAEIAGLQATLESLADGILVTDLRGRIRNYNRRFADLWEVPDELLLQRADDAVRDWMQRNVVDPARYARRLAAIDDAAMLRASDVVTLRSGRVIERVTVPQCSRGTPIGRLFVFREISQPVRRLGPTA